MNPIQDELKSRVEISVACKNLKDLDIFSKSDPMAVLFQNLNNSYVEIGRTETIKNNLNPVFTKSFEIDYHFEERQMFKIEIYDIDSSSNRLADHEFLGRVDFSLGELVSRRKLESKLSNRFDSNTRKPQLVNLTCTELPTSKELIILQFIGTKLDKKDLFGKSDPILQIYRSSDPIIFLPTENKFIDNKNFLLVYQTKPIMNTLNPSWPEFTVKLSRLCLGDKDRLIKLVCTDWNSSGKLDFIGHCFTSVNNLLENQRKHEAFVLINEKKLKKKSYNNSGTLTLNKASVQYEYSFFDYISGGTELNFTVAIDFTASNGNKNDPTSLHFIPQYDFAGPQNQYETAIVSVGSIIQDYDSDKMFPALGFGARIPPQNEISHCFPINFCLQNPFCAGITGLLNTYRTAIRSVTLYGPTNFSPSIRHMQQFALQYRDGSKYFVLLIITDGIISDFEATIDAIIDCSFLPMSLIIIGVGNEDFSAMDFLDCDKGHLRYGNKIAQRDIVQFVAMRDFIDVRTRSVNQNALNKAVLFELPGQVTSWMKINSIVPLKPNTNISQPLTGNAPPPYPISDPFALNIPHPM